MKKITKLLFVFTSILLAFGTSLSLKAQNIPNWEFLPLGYNYLDPDNFNVSGSYSFFEVSNFNSFRVKPNTEYTLFQTFPTETFFGNHQVTAYDANSVLITSDFVFEYTHYDGNYSTITFTTPANTKYLDIDFEIIYDGSEPCDFYPLDEYIVLWEGTSYPGTQEESVIYEGPDINYDPVISGNNGYYYTDVNNPVSAATIKSGLIAMDDVDGDITSSIIIHSDGYTAHKNTLGEYPIVFQVSDSSQNTTNFTVYVIVVDNDDPVISGKNSHTFKETSLVPLSYFQSFLTATDNYDGVLTNHITVSSDNYSSNYNVLGTHTIIFSVSDSSNNVGTYTVSVVVQDGTPPVFSGPQSINKGNNTTITLASIISQISAFDSVDGNVSSKIVVESDNYSRNSNRVGSWEIELSCQDNLLNTSYYTITVNVTDVVHPLFMINQQVITIELSDNHLGVQDFIKVLVKTKAISEEAVVSVIADEYSDNKNTPGTYKIILGVGDDQMDLEVNVIEGLYEQLQDANPNLWQRIINWFSHIWQVIKGFFINLFEIIFK
ncbi:MAG TPA: hypothetical protein PLR16_02400 [Bacilli bacterium]|nr:MAG: hypothetical protein BWY97_00663 [Tenericutes bacterium ADurb.BinA124]HNZ50252.1 hypothetical protein [Bacilli bacterium]HPX84119.1 hypothetical protein [Bacilli bacterium]